MHKKILVVAAHPDDEILGCGGTIAKYVKQGHKIKTIILTRGVSSRFKNDSYKINKLQKKLNNASKLANKAIGVKDLKFFDLPDNQFDQTSLLSLVKIIEKEIKIFKPCTIFTHYINDLNIDHQYTSKAVITAARPHSKSLVREILFFEINSSTDYQINSNGFQFQPNLFIDISKTIKQKKGALKAYNAEMMSYPNSRSIKSVINRNLALGNSVGLEAAEAFQIVRKIEK